MATRTGDLDPGVLLYLQRAKKMDADSLEKLLNHDAGLKALSGGTSDMRKLQIAAGQGDQNAKLAMEVFCLAIRKFIAAYASVLGGLDMLIFAGGIGEHSVQVRSGVCDGLTLPGDCDRRDEKRGERRDDLRARELGESVRRSQPGRSPDCTPLPGLDAKKLILIFHIARFDAQLILLTAAGPRSLDDLQDELGWTVVRRGAFPAG